MLEKTILTCAVTGGSMPHPDHENFPITPKQIAEACLEAANAGASVVHIHVREPDTGRGSDDPKLFKEVVDRIRDSATDIVINLTAGLGATLHPDPEDETRGLPTSRMKPAEDRMRHVVENLPEIASFDITAGNRQFGPTEAVYMNTPYSMRKMAKIFQECGVKPELEVFHAGDIDVGKTLMKEGLIDGIPFFQCVLGVPWSMPAGQKALELMASIMPENAQWSAFGIGRDQMPCVARSALMGGHIRVGLEDNHRLSRGVFANNGQLVERAKTIVEFMGGSIATPQEAREILQLKKQG